ncbi:MAG: hypothetical protein GX559_00220 [Candidatus Pacebacteria bacterium]|nr:hypothetical protein [Candidatus Paceibacterota bacterium]
MSKKKTGVLPLIVGAVTGAAAVFFSDEKNRKKVKKTYDEVKKNPEAFARKTAKSVEKSARKLANQAKAAGKKTLSQQKKAIKKALK